MSRWICLAAVTLASVFSSTLHADLAVPGQKRSTRVTLPVTIRRGAIRGEDNTVQAKMVIPTYMLAEAVERTRGVTPKAKSEGTPPAPGASGGPAAPPAAPETAPKSEARAVPPLRTIIAGLAMSLAAISLVFVMRGSRAGKAVALVALSSAIVLGAYRLGQADVPPTRASTDIVIELVEEGETVTLLLTR